MSEPLERALPHCAAAERAILGAILIDAATYNDNLLARVRGELSPEDFYVAAHRAVFRAMICAADQSAEIEPVQLGEELRRMGTLEQVGWVAFVVDLMSGMPLSMNIEHYMKIVLEHSLRRRIARVGNRLYSDALELEIESNSILSCADKELAQLSEAAANMRRPLFTSLNAFFRHDFDDGEEIAFNARRGEIALVQSVTNHGKSTLVRNASVALSVGAALPPIVPFGKPRRVLLLNLEGAGGWFQHDLSVMVRSLSIEQRALADVNFFPTHAPQVEGALLSLTQHMHRVRHEAQRLGVDVLVVDTASMAFALRNENDNAEVANGVMKPLIRLARWLNCLVVLIHHVGKAKSEEGRTREQAHRGRGASAWGDFSTSIFNLEADAHDQTRATLTCGKRKNGERYERVLILDRETRWFRLSDEAPTRPTTNTDLVLETIQSLGLPKVRTSEILAGVAEKMSRRTVMGCLKRLSELGKIESTGRGRWILIGFCAICAKPYKGLHICTNEAGGDKGLSMLELTARAGAPSNGNGLRGGLNVSD